MSRARKGRIERRVVAVDGGRRESGVSRSLACTVHDRIFPNHGNQSNKPRPRKLDTPLPAQLPEGVFLNRSYANRTLPVNVNHTLPS